MAEINGFLLQQNHILQYTVLDLCQIFCLLCGRKNRKPASMLPPVAEKFLTPPAGPKSGRLYGKLGGGSKSVNSSEKRSGGIITRKSPASVEELKVLGAATNNNIDDGKTRGRIDRTLFGHRQF